MAGLPDKKRKERLEDTRTYSASVRLEVLLTAAVIQQDLYEKVRKARVQRNKIVHRAKADFSSAIDCADALKAMVEFVCKREVAIPSSMYMLGW